MSKWMVLVFVDVTMPSISASTLLDRCFLALHILYLCFLALGMWVYIDDYVYTAVDGSSPFCSCNPLPSVYDDLLHYGYTQLVHASSFGFSGIFALVGVFLAPRLRYPLWGLSILLLNIDMPVEYAAAGRTLMEIFASGS